MVKLDHLTVCVGDHLRSRDWYVRNFGFKVELEIAECDTVALQDDAGLTVFLVRSPAAVAPQFGAFTVQVDGVEGTHAG